MNDFYIKGKKKKIAVPRPELAEAPAQMLDWNEPHETYGLADGNSFYNSCETIYLPHLRDTPLVTCSNGDGCLIALNPQAKALGLKMGTPRYEVDQFMKDNGVTWFSSCYELYGAVSSRMMMHFSKYVPGLYVYSIDEAFFRLTGWNNFPDLGRRIIAEPAMCIRMPICFGVAPSKSPA